MINTVVLTGRLTKVPELKYTQSGVAICRFTLAVNRAFSNQKGEREADFINCVVWRKLAENTANYLQKGSFVGIEGRIQTSNFEGKDGNRVYMTDVVATSVQFLEPKSQSNASNRYGHSQNQQQTPLNNQSAVNHDQYNTHGGPVNVLDDDLPF